MYEYFFGGFVGGTLFQMLMPFQLQMLHRDTITDKPNLDLVQQNFVLRLSTTECLLILSTAECLLRLSTVELGAQIEYSRDSSYYNNSKEIYWNAYILRNCKLIKSLRLKLRLSTEQ